SKRKNEILNFLEHNGVFGVLFRAFCLDVAMWGLRCQDLPRPVPKGFRDRLTKQRKARKNEKEDCIAILSCILRFSLLKKHAVVGRQLIQVPILAVVANPVFSTIISYKHERVTLNYPKFENKDFYDDYLQ